jgi:hypothetical protein
LRSRYHHRYHCRWFRLQLVTAIRLDLLLCCLLQIEFRRQPLDFPMHRYRHLIRRHHLHHLAVFQYAIHYHHRLQQSI